MSYYIGTFIDVNCSQFVMIMAKLKYSFKVVPLVMVLLLLLSISNNGYSLSLCRDSIENTCCCCAEYNEMSSDSSSIIDVQLTKECGCKKITLNEFYRDKDYVNTSNKTSLLVNYVRSIIRGNNNTLFETIHESKNIGTFNLDQKYFISFQNLRI